MSQTWFVTRDDYSRLELMVVSLHRSSPQVANSKRHCRFLCHVFLVFEIFGKVTQATSVWWWEVIVEMSRLMNYSLGVGLHGETIVDDCCCFVPGSNDLLVLSGSEDRTASLSLYQNDIVYNCTVTNTGNVPLSNITVTDSRDDVTPVYVSGDDNNDGLLDLNETWLYQANGTADVATFNYTGSVSGEDDTTGEVVTSDDPSSYFTPSNASVSIDLVTNGADGLEIQFEDPIVYNYTVTHAGNVPLSNITVTDIRDDVSPVYVSGDDNNDGLLDLNETWVCQFNDTAEVGTFTCTRSVSGEDDTTGEVTTSEDPSSYSSPSNASATIVFDTNGDDGREIPFEDPIV